MSAPDDSELEAIRKRNRGCKCVDCRDRDALLRMMDELRVDNEAHRRVMGELKDFSVNVIVERDELRAKLAEAEKKQ